MIIVYLSFVSYRQGRRQLTSSVSPFGALACTGTKLCKAADSFYAIYGRAQSGAHAPSDTGNPRGPALPSL